MEHPGGPSWNVMQTKGEKFCLRLAGSFFYIWFLFYASLNNLIKLLHFNIFFFRNIPITCFHLCFLGSPLPVFLSLRWRDPTNTDYHDHILPRDRVKFLYNIYHPCDPVAYRIEPIFMKIYAQLEPVHIYPYNEVYKIPYSQLPLQLLVRKDQQGQGENQQMGLPVNIANGSINVDITKMASGMAGGMLSGDQAAGAHGQTVDPTGQGQQSSNGWGFLSMMKNTVAAVTPSGGQNPQFGAATNGHGGQGMQPQMAIGQQFNLPDGKRLAYRMDYCVRESGRNENGISRRFLLINQHLLVMVVSNLHFITIGQI